MPLPNFNLEALTERLPEWLEHLGAELCWSSDRSGISCACPACGRDKAKGESGGFQAKLTPEGWKGGCWRNSCILNGFKHTVALAMALYGLDFLNAGLRVSELLGVPLTNGNVPYTPKAIAERKERLEERRLREEQARHDQAVRDLIGEGVYETLLNAFDEAAQTMTRDWRNDLRKASPLRLDGDPAQNCRLVVSQLLLPRIGHDEVIWNGERFDSGKPKHARHFLTPAELLARDTPLGGRITFSTYEPGTITRSASVKRVIFRLLESDKLIGRDPKSPDERELNKMLCLVFFHWLHDNMGIRFAAIIDTGNKSLHGWVDLSEEQLSDLLHFFSAVHPPHWPPVLNKRTGQWEAATYQPLDVQASKRDCSIFRLPGAIHEKTKQPAQLLYLDPSA